MLPAALSESASFPPAGSNRNPVSVALAAWPFGLHYKEPATNQPIPEWWKLASDTPGHFLRKENQCP